MPVFGIYPDAVDGVTSIEGKDGDLTLRDLNLDKVENKTGAEIVNENVTAEKIKTVLGDEFFDGDYENLTNKPTIPADQSEAVASLQSDVASLKSFAAAGLILKGTIESESELAGKKDGAKPGDFYICTGNSHEYVWDGEDFVDVGPTTAGFATSEELANAIKDKISGTELEKKLEDYATTKALSDAVKDLVDNDTLEDAIKDFVDNDSLSETLEDYAKTDALEEAVKDVAKTSDITSLTGKINQLTPKTVNQATATITTTVEGWTGQDGAYTQEVACAIITNPTTDTIISVGVEQDEISKCKVGVSGASAGKLTFKAAKKPTKAINHNVLVLSNNTVAE